MTKRQAIIRIIVTYLLVLLPLLVVSFLVTQTLLQNVEQEAFAKINGELDRVTQTLSEDYLNYTNKGVGLLQLKPFSYGQIIGNPITQLEAIDMLQKLRLFDGRVNEIMVYYGDGYLCGNNGITSPQVYFQKTLNCTVDSAKDAVKLLQSRQSGVIALETTVGLPYVMYHIAVGQDVMGRLRSVQFFFPVSDFERTIASALQTNEVLLQMNFENAALYFYNYENGCRFLYPDEVQVMLADSTQGAHNLARPGQNIDIRIWYNNAQHMQSYHQIRNVSFLILLIGVFLSTVLSLGMGFSRLQSIKRLASNIIGKQVSKSKKKIWVKNEFDYIQALIDESVKDSKTVEKNVRNYRHIILQQVAMMIFHGILRDYQEIQSLLSICGTELAEEYFYLCGIKLKRREDVQRLEVFISEDLHYTDDDRFVIMLCQLHSYDYNMHLRKAFAKRLVSTLRSIDIECDWVGMSQVYNQISMANYAYLEITSMVEHSEERNGLDSCWEDLVTHQNQHSFQFVNENLQVFYGAVEQKNRRQAEKMLDRIFAAKGDEENEAYIRYMVLQALRLGTRSVFDDSNADLQNLLNEIGMEDSNFAEGVKDVLREYCKSDSVYDKILEYVNENYMRYDLSLEQLAEEARISKAQMSKTFRAKTGVGYIDYVTNLRMEKAKELLADTSLSVKEIFTKVGYIDSTNASKKFKAIYNTTPSAYRTAMQKDETADHEDDGNG